MAFNYPVCGSAVQDGGDDIYWTAWCLKDGAPDAAATACVVTLYLSDGDGTESAVAGATETVAADAGNGVFNGKITKTLTPGRNYYFIVSITSDAVARLGVIPLAVPVRTS